MSVREIENWRISMRSAREIERAPPERLEQPPVVQSGPHAQQPSVACSVSPGPFDLASLYWHPANHKTITHCIPLLTSHK